MPQAAISTSRRLGSSHVYRPGKHARASRHVLVRLTAGRGDHLRRDALCRLRPERECEPALLERSDLGHRGCLLAVVTRDWTLLTKVETSCDRILIAGGANVEAEWEQGPAV